MDRSIPFFDGYAFLDQEATTRASRPEDMFRDEFHCHPEIQQALGARLATCVEYAFLSGSLGATVRPVWSAAFCSVAAAADADRIKHVSNRLLEIDLVQLRENDSLNFTLPAGSKIAGLVFNMKTTNSALEIGGRTTKRLDHPVRGFLSFWIAAWNLVSPIEINAEYTAVRCVRSRLDGNFEMNEHNSPSVDYSDQDPPLVELAGLVYFTPSNSKPIARVDGITIDTIKYISAPI